MAMPRLAPSKMIPLPFIPTLTLLVVGGVLGGCANDNLTDPDFGNSVRAMIALQTAHPGRGTSGLDGEKAAKTLEEYRKDVAKPQKVDQEQLTAVTGGGE